MNNYYRLKKGDDYLYFSVYECSDALSKYAIAQYCDIKIGYNPIIDVDSALISNNTMLQDLTLYAKRLATEYYYRRDKTLKSIENLIRIGSNKYALNLLLESKMLYILDESTYNIYKLLLEEDF